MDELFVSQQPRIAPIPPAERDETIQELLAKLRGRAEFNIFTTLIRHESLFKEWVRFGTQLLLKGVLPDRDRELLILRTAWLNHCGYEWIHHEEMAAEIGMELVEFDRVKDGPDHPDWSEFEATLLRAVDELHEGGRITDATWAALADRYDEQQLIELPALVGFYHTVAFYLNSIGIQLEPGYEVR